MQTKVGGEIECFYLNHGVSKKGNTYLRVSNGEEAFFLSCEIDPEELKDIERMQEVRLEVERDFFSDYGKKAIAIL